MLVVCQPYSMDFIGGHLSPPATALATSAGFAGLRLRQPVTLSQSRSPRGPGQPPLRPESQPGLALAPPIVGGHSPQVVIRPRPWGQDAQHPARPGPDLRTPVLPSPHPVPP